MEPINDLKLNKNKIIKKTRRNLNKYQSNSITSRVLPLTRKSINKFFKEGGVGKEKEYFILEDIEINNHNYDIKKISKKDPKLDLDTFIKDVCQKECKQLSECFGFTVNTNNMGQTIATLIKERSIVSRRKLESKRESETLEQGDRETDDNFNSRINDKLNEGFVIKSQNQTSLGKKSIQIVKNFSSLYLKDYLNIANIVSFLENLFFKDVSQDEKFSEFTTEIKSEKSEEQYKKILLAIKQLFIYFTNKYYGEKDEKEMDDSYFDQIKNQLNEEKKIVLDSNEDIIKYLDSYAIILISFIRCRFFLSSTVNPL